MATILIIEDDHDTVEIATIILEADGHTVISATTIRKAEKAVDAVIAGEIVPDIITIDGALSVRTLTRKEQTDQPETPYLVRQLRQAGFNKPIIAASNRDDWNEILVNEAGCSHSVKDKQIAQAVNQILAKLGQK